MNDEMKMDMEESIFCPIDALYKELSKGIEENKEQHQSRFEPGISRIQLLLQLTVR